MLRVTIPKIYSKDRKLTSSRHRHRTHACSGATVLIEFQATLVCSMLGGLPFTLALGTASGAGVAGGPPGGAPSAAGAGRGGAPDRIRSLDLPGVAGCGRPPEAPGTTDNHHHRPSRKSGLLS